MTKDSDRNKIGYHVVQSLPVTIHDSFRCAGRRGFGDLNCFVVAGWALKKDWKSGKAARAVAELARKAADELKLPWALSTVVGRSHVKRMHIIDGKRKLCVFCWGSIEIDWASVEIIVRNTDMGRRSSYTPDGNGLTRGWSQSTIQRILEKGKNES